jgi:probable phosphoglycerate mutase
LSTLGVEQATAAATRVAGFTAVYTSDLARARRTAEILGAALHLEPRLDARLRERDAAAWEGRTRPEIEAEWPGYLAEGRRPPGYETDDSVLARALAAITAIAERQTGDILVVSHFGVIRSLERRLAGPEGFTDVSVPNLGGRWLHHEAGRLRLGAPELLLDEARATRPEQI